MLTAKEIERGLRALEKLATATEKLAVQMEIYNKEKNDGE